MVFCQAPLKLPPPAKTSRDPSIFARREETEGLRINNELSLEDLVMDVRPETPRAPLARAPKPAAPTAPLQRAARLTARRFMPPRAPLAAALASIALLGAAFAAFVFFRRPDPSRNHQSPAGVADSDTAKNRPIVTNAPAPPPESVAKILFDGTSGQGWMLCDRKPVPRRSIQRDGLNPHGTGSYLVVYDQKLGDFVLYKTINLDEWTVPGKRPDGTDHRFKNVALARLARRGYVGFQDLGGDCWFKNVVVTTPPISGFPAPAPPNAGGGAATPRPWYPRARVARPRAGYGFIRRLLGRGIDRAYPDSGDPVGSG